MEEKKNSMPQDDNAFVAKVETLLFNSRWLLAPMYLGLVIALLLLLIKFGHKFFKIIPSMFEFTSAELILRILELVDVVLVANLLLMIIFSGYENFVSKIDVANGHEDRPSWMGTIDYSGLKMKITGSIVAISSIELLKYFININMVPREELAWLIGLHMTFVFSGVIFAYTEKIAHGDHHPVSHDDEKEKNNSHH